MPDRVSYPFQPERHPSLFRMMVGLAAVDFEPHDPDMTMQFAFTQRELAATVAGLNALGLLHPELGGVVAALLAKIEDVSQAQQFLPQGGEPT